MSEIVKQRKKTREPNHHSRIKLVEQKIELRSKKKLEKIVANKLEENVTNKLEEIVTNKFEENLDQNLDHKLDVKLENVISRFNFGENLNSQAYDYGDPHRLDTSKVCDT